jgi:hypothetical protein
MNEQKAIRMKKINPLIQLFFGRLLASYSNRLGS